MHVFVLRELGCLRMNVVVLRQFVWLIDVDLRILGEAVKIEIACRDRSNLVLKAFSLNFGRGTPS